MADMLNSHAEMLCDERNLTCRLRNTINALNDDIKHKITRMKELATILNSTVKETEANVHAHGNYTKQQWLLVNAGQKCSYQPTSES